MGELRSWRRPFVRRATRTGLQRSGSRVVRPQVWLATWRLQGSFQAQAYEDVRRFWAQAEGLANYASVEEHEKLVRAEIGRLSERGFVTVYKTWADVIKRFGNVVVSKMAAVVKPREDGTTKLRLIIDMLRSHVNELPRIGDMVRDSVSLLEGSSDGGDVDLMILDWEDAFHTMGVRAEELQHQIVKRFDGECGGVRDGPVRGRRTKECGGGPLPF